MSNTPSRSAYLSGRTRAALAMTWTLLAALLAAGCSSNASSNSASVNNVQAIAVNAGPAQNYVDGAFTSVKICAPGSTSNCQTINGVLVDSGSSGLRLLASAVSLSLPIQAVNSNQIGECLPFVSFYTWGPIETADIYLAGEEAPSAAVQIIGDSTFASAPSACTSGGTTGISTLSDLGANGILGVSVFQHDCGAGCTLSGGSNPNIYFSCSGSTCTATSEPLDSQVQNPVGLFAQDNNGVILQLPTVSANGAATVSGNMIFGIGTQSNNTLGSATIFPTNSQGDFTVQYNGQSYASSYIDSGSNGIFFLDSSTAGIPTCPSPNASFYCPANTQNLTATNVGNDGTSGAVNFSIANANDLFNTGNTAFDNLGGVNSGSFDWGLAFFFGRKVYTAINGRPAGKATGPYWAY